MVKRLFDQIQSDVLSEDIDSHIDSSDIVQDFNDDDSSEISQPSTKIIRIDDDKRSQVLTYSDKCIQVDSSSDNQLFVSSNSIDDHNNDSQNVSSIKLDYDISDNSQTITDEQFQESIQNENSNDSKKDSSRDLINLIPQLVDNSSNISNDKLDSINDSTEDSTDDKETESNQFISDEKTQIDLNDETSSSSSGVLSISNDENATTSNSSDSEKKDIRSVLKVAGRKPKIKKKVHFNEVTVYYFIRSQGFTCVPSQGGSTLGMENNHVYSRKFTLETHAEERKKVHKEILLRQKRFAKMNKQSSTSESDDDSYDDLSDFSDIDFENDNCYFLQPVPIKQRRALLRASGVRKIETTEKEECRDIRISREFCGCNCRAYCNPELCSCSQAGIKCQVDRMSFPCGCSREGCCNANGRVEFNPVRVRTHFIHTIMRIEMENKQTQDGNHLMTTDSYPASTSNYNQSISSACNQTIPSSSVYMPIQNNMHTSDSASHMMVHDSNGSYISQNCVNLYNTEYSPDNSSYSENSDYTSDDLEEEYNHEKPNKLYHPTSNFISNQEMVHINSLSNSSSLTQSSSSNLLPPFPTINPSCDMSTANTYKENPCHAYQDSNMYHNAYNYSSIHDNNMQPHQGSMFISHSSYDMNNSTNYDYTSEYKQSYSEVGVNGHHTGEPAMIHVANNNHVDNQQQYIDLSLSIASSSSAESLLSAANTSDEDSRLTPVSFRHISSGNIYPINNSVTNICSNPFTHNYDNPKVDNSENKEQYSEIVCSSQSNVSEASITSDNITTNDNFGEIIKKSIVESVSA